jgi:DNA-binding NtrC family response regulator
MARVVLIGEDAALLEGLAQSLSAAGHFTSVSATTAMARETFRSDPPLVVVAERRMGAELTRTKLAPGGALLLFRGADEGEPTPLPPAAQRAALADLTLPLERHRLMALVAYVDERAASTGRTPSLPPPTHPPI